MPATRSRWSDGEQLLEQPPRPLVLGTVRTIRLDQVERAVGRRRGGRAQLGAPVGDVGHLGRRREAAALPSSSSRSRQRSRAA